MHRKETSIYGQKNLKPIPKFKSEAEERKFWETHDSTEYLDWSKAESVRFPNLIVSKSSKPRNFTTSFPVHKLI